jgi:hypothetical protein
MTFKSPERLEAHLRVPAHSICPIQTRDPEVGITEDVQKRLGDRTGHGKIATWTDLWNLLFPDDRVV